jgi:cyclomaltodextrin glucanotransferase
MHLRPSILVVALPLALLVGCAHSADIARPAPPVPDYVGTTEPMAADAVYFVVTDRYVNGDPSNDQRDQGRDKGAAYFTFDRPTPGAEAEGDNIGYLGGDFRGVLDNADTIRDMGFGAVWITPIIDNPDEAFTGGKPAVKGGFLTDGGKTGYHGYWGVNFYRLDEHLPSEGLDFAAFTKAMRDRQLKVVLDIVANHGSPAYSMPKPQPPYGQLFDRDGRLIADHQNLPPDQLDPANNPLHAFYNTKPGLAELSDTNENNPAVLDYFVGAYSQWIDQGAHAFRVDTIPWLPHGFWKAFADRIREKRPGFFMFGEAFDYKAEKIAEHTWVENGAYSVLDFPLKEAMAEVFGRQRLGYERIAPRLFLDGGPYRDPYALMTFYDNHDMPRLDASDAGFIDAHNFLFTARGIPVIYYGSETGFMRGAAEHGGNRNYYGQARVDAGRDHPIQQAMRRIARVRAATPALQRGLQVNIEMAGDRAAFYRVLQHDGVSQIALVLLNKGNVPADFAVRDKLQPGAWRSALDEMRIDVKAGDALRATVPAHGVQVFVLDAPVRDAALRAALDRAAKGAKPRG